MDLPLHPQRAINQNLRVNYYVRYKTSASSTRWLDSPTLDILLLLSPLLQAAQGRRVLFAVFCHHFSCMKVYNHLPTTAIWNRRFTKLPTEIHIMDYRGQQSLKVSDFFFSLAFVSCHLMSEISHLFFPPLNYTRKRKGCVVWSVRMFVCVLQ